MPGKLSKNWKQLCQNILNKGPYAYELAKETFYLWLLSQYKPDSIRQHAQRLEQILKRTYEKQKT